MKEKATCQHLLKGGSTCQHSLKEDSRSELSRFDENSPCVAPGACRARTICIRAFQGEIPIHLQLSFVSTWIKWRKVELELFLLQVQLARCIKDQSTSKPLMNDFSNFRHNIVALGSLPSSPTWIHTVEHVNAQGAAHNEIHLECVNQAKS